MKKKTMTRITLSFLAFFLTSSIILADNFPSSASYEVGFSPHGNSLNLVLKGIAKAQSSILIAAYSFTSKPIASALLKAHKRGVQVEIVADQKENRKAYSAVSFMANQGIPVRLNNHFQILHDKFMIIDGQHLETGSFNYTAAATNRNAENVLLLLNVKPLADQFTHEWKILWNSGIDLKAAY
ncbi:MAG: Cardiolipin synthase [Candidatus Tokpelaia sp. JSC161]|jgi:phosphatidylserine/phosphatidylglycerophosphate/cardiolipin synthase-like enzyme|nr:MAG: Cardiolipin synthase [Candidatus Tokpelaia sp. JSC161]